MCNYSILHIIYNKIDYFNTGGVIDITQNENRSSIHTGIKERNCVLHW